MRTYNNYTVGSSSDAGFAAAGIGTGGGGGGGSGGT